MNFYFLGSHPDFVEKDYHAIRILSKETRFTLEIIQKCFPDKSALQDINNALRGVHQALGKWHDFDTGLKMLEDFKEDFKDSEYFDKNSYVTFEKVLQKEKTIKLEDFENKWGVFLEVTQEDEC